MIAFALALALVTPRTRGMARGWVAYELTTALPRVLS